MCGIAGIVDLEGRADIAPGRIKAMTDAIARRGPDGEGQWRAPGVALGHRRLAIIDPTGGAQPMVATEGRVAVVFNGMIYNFRALRSELELGGAVFTTECDTEVLLHGWRAWGTALPERLDGFFAAAIWDAEAESLFLMRDLWGKKPLYFSRRGDMMLFGSDTDAILAGMDRTPDIAPDALADYLAFGYVPEPKSIFEGIERLPPAHRMLVRRGEAARMERWGGIQIDPVDNGRTMEDAAAELEPLLRAAVRKRMIADVPLGAFLSGGVDSGAMVAFMSQEGGRPVRACTMGFDDPALDESAPAMRVARRYGAEHWIERVRSEPDHDIAALGEAFAEPFADASALPTLRLCGLSARRVKVAVSGDGGDELFAGYARYPAHLREEKLKRLMPALARGAVFGPLAQAAPGWTRAEATLTALSGDAMAGLFRATAILDEASRDALLAPGAQVGGYSSVEVLRAHAARAQTDDPLARAQFVDLNTWLPGRMLVKTDRASMARGVEIRNPLLDRDIALWAARLPTRLKLGKAVLKQSLRPHIPSAVLDARKRGFVAPIAEWMRGPLAPRMEALSTGMIAEYGLVEPRSVARLWSMMRDGQVDMSRPLWSLLMLEGFLQRLNQRSTPMALAG